MKSISSRDFNGSASRVRQEATIQPVQILNRGQPTHVLMSIAHYRALVGMAGLHADQFGMPEVEDARIEPQSRIANALGHQPSESLKVGPYMRALVAEMQTPKSEAAVAKLLGMRSEEMRAALKRNQNL